MTIPKKIFQTHKSLAYVNSKPKLMAAMNSWLKYKGEYEYHFFTNEMCDTFMREKVGGIVYQAYKRLPMGVMKADLWRYCVIYCYGGIYVKKREYESEVHVLLPNLSGLKLFPDGRRFT